VYERKPGGIIYARVLDRSPGSTKGYRRVSLGHTDHEVAKVYAVEEAARLRTGRSDLIAGRITLERLFGEYLTYRTPRKTPGEQKEDGRRAKMWTKVLGAQKDPHTISLGDWESFIDARKTGQVGADGSRLPVGSYAPVRDRTVEADLKWLRWVLNWGSRWRDQQGRYLLRENAVRGFDLPVEKNPVRPLASDDRFDALRAVSDQVRMELRWGTTRARQRSYLSELLDLAHGTGRRIRAICSLTYQDLKLTSSPGAPHGAIQWPGQTDKEGKAWSAPINPQVRQALERVLLERPGIGPAYLFPCPTDHCRPVQYERVRHWLLVAEKLADLPKQAGSSFHAFRRSWATARKHLPAADVAAAGGWSSTITLDRCYQQPDTSTILLVVLGRNELREKQA